jgi:hypothetical protein
MQAVSREFTNTKRSTNVQQVGDAHSAMHAHLPDKHHKHHASDTEILKQCNTAYVWRDAHVLDCVAADIALLHVPKPVGILYDQKQVV